MFVFGIGASQV